MCAVVRCSCTACAGSIASVSERMRIIARCQGSSLIHVTLQAFDVRACCARISWRSTLTLRLLHRGGERPGRHRQRRAKAVPSQPSLCSAAGQRQHHRLHHSSIQVLTSVSPVLLCDPGCIGLTCRVCSAGALFQSRSWRKEPPRGQQVLCSSCRTADGASLLLCQLLHTRQLQATCS